MKLSLPRIVAVCTLLHNRAVFSQPSSAAAGLSVEAIPSAITKEATCSDWVSWIPPTTDPAIVMQVVSEDYVDLEKNFIRLMELNSALTRQHLYLMCLDDASVAIFESLGIRCVPMRALELHSHEKLWKARVRVLSCLVSAGYDIIMSDSDALWLGDPMEYMNSSSSSSSSVIASRGGYPRALGDVWGSTMCMGFIMFRANGAAMSTFQDTMERIVLETGDDQVAVNRAALDLGIAWDEGSDMRFTPSTGFGKGVIADLFSEDGQPFEVTLLPHKKFQRHCATTHIANGTVVAHCFHQKRADAKTGWMQEVDLWSPHISNP